MIGLQSEKKKSGGPLARDPSLIFWAKLPTVAFWAPFYILSVYSSNKVSDLCRGDKTELQDDEEQHHQISAESPESQRSFIHLTFQGDFVLLNLTI